MKTYLISLFAKMVSEAKNFGAFTFVSCLFATLAVRMGGVERNVSNTQDIVAFPTPPAQLKGHGVEFRTVEVVEINEMN